MVLYGSHQICMIIMKIKGFAWKLRVLHEHLGFCMRNIQNNGFCRVMCAGLVSVCVLSRGQCVVLLVKQDMLPADVVQSCI